MKTYQIIENYPTEYLVLARNAAVEGLQPDFCRWRISFIKRTKSGGVRYCHAAQPKTKTIDDVRNWAVTQCEARGFFGARIYFG